MPIVWAPPAHALTKTWTGAVNDNWSTAANWSPPLVPVDGDDLVFTTSDTSINDIPDLEIASIDFSMGTHIINESLGITLTVTGDIEAASGSVGTFALHVALPAGNHLVNANGSVAFDGPVSGSGSIEKTGSGVLDLTAENTYEGVTTVNSGRLRVWSPNALGATEQGTVVEEGSSMHFFTESIETIFEPIEVSGEGLADWAALELGNATLAGPLMLSSQVVSIDGVSLPPARITGAVSGTAVMKVVGMLELSGVDSRTAGIEVHDGRVIAASNTAFGLGTVTATALGSIVLSGGVEIGNPIVFKDATGSSLNIFSTNGENVLTGQVDMFDSVHAFAEDGLTISGDIRGEGNLHPWGPGFLLLSGNNTFGGKTTVHGGWTILEGTSGQTIPGDAEILEQAGMVLFDQQQFADSSHVTIAHGGTLDLFGWDESLRKLESLGDLYLGSVEDEVFYPSILSVQDLNLSGGSLHFGIGSTASDLLVASNSVSLGSVELRPFLASLPALGEEIFIINQTGSRPVLGEFLEAPEGAVLVGGEDLFFQISYKGGDGNDVTLTRVETAGGGPVPTTDQGYWMVASDGGIFAFGEAGFYGSTGSLRLNQPVVGMTSTPSGNGYWLVASDGGIFAFGDAGFYGSTGSLRLNQPVVGMASTPSGNGYWLVASDGGIFAFGDAGFYGSTGSLRLNQPVVGVASTPSGNGYWLVASDGGIFAFGDAGFYGSTGGMRLNELIVGIASTHSGHGYWLVASDGGIFAFGDTGFYGSAGGFPLFEPIVEMARTPSGNGYWMVGADGAVFEFGDAAFLGDMSEISLNLPIVGMAVTP